MTDTEQGNSFMRDLNKGELAEAALCYARLYIACVNPDSPNAAASPISVPSSWPFDAADYEGESEAINYLFKAQALIETEIRRWRAKDYADRLLREMRKADSDA
jgi:hypothetical protein